MVPDVALVDRFRANLDALIRSPARLGIAVSGGPDSLALLLLAAAARPGEVEAATVDHGLRPGSRDEANMVAGICKKLRVPHSVLAIEWDVAPVTAIQEQARIVRYGALSAWLEERGLDGLLTGHHVNDQAETLMMRLNRGSGVGGLAGMRASSPLPGSRYQLLLRPLLGWRSDELARICSHAGLAPVCDPSNSADNFERVRVRQGLASADWIDPEAVARSAENLASADEALCWAAEKEWTEFVNHGANEIVYRASTAPMEIVRRIVSRAVRELATEGDANELRGRELDRLIAELQGSRTATLRGVRCSGGLEWRFAGARPRKKQSPA